MIAPRDGNVQKWALVLLAIVMSLFGLVVLSQQVFAWHHLKVVTVIAAAMLAMGLCGLYDGCIKARL